MEEDQRLFLLEDFEETVADFRRDLGEDREPGPKTALLIEGYDRAIAWLRSGVKGDASLREFLEGRLDQIDEELDYEAVVYEHDAYAAAVTALRRGQDER